VPGAKEKKAAEREHLSALYRNIYKVVRTIPYGKVATYGQVAELADIPRAARVVGTAMRACSAESGIPWHRVVGKRSRGIAKVSILDPVGGAIQRKLLEEEGVHFTDSAGISLAEHGWLPLETSLKGSS
jgi:methylated-DNA-protein-cysteine methyltransferase-like protein